MTPMTATAKTTRSTVKTNASAAPAPEELELFARIAALIEDAGTVAVSGHTDPDGDALGSVLALTAIIEARWPQVRVQPLLANDRPVDRAYAFLPGANRLMPAARYALDPDVFIAVDTPTPERLADARAVMERAGATVLIDHHPSRCPYARESVVRDSAASAGDVVCDFMAYLGVDPTPQIATCILTAVMTDTGRFQYQNTDAHALKTAAAMVEAGARTSEIALNVYQSYSLGALKLKERVLARLATAEGGAIAYSWVTQADLAELGAIPADCDSLIDDVRTLEGSCACLFMREQPDGSVRGNLRSKVDWLDVSEAAALFGGGGHRAAAGFTVQGPVEEGVSTALRALARQIEADAAARPQGRCR